MKTAGLKTENKLLIFGTSKGKKVFYIFFFKAVCGKAKLDAACQVKVMVWNVSVFRSYVLLWLVVRMLIQ